MNKKIFMGKVENLAVMYNKKHKVLGIIILIIVSICIAGYLETFMEAVGLYKTGVYTGVLGRSLQTVNYIRLLLIFAFTLVVGSVLWKFHSAILHFVYKYRFVIALAILIICVVLEISGSSIAYWAKLIGSDKTGVLFGIPRDIRGDEYATLTPFNFSQYYNYSGQYPYFSDTIRGTSTDTFISYGLPSWNIGTVYRPFLWGYLILGPARGLSFFWVARFLVLFLVSFEFAMVYTKKDKYLSLAAGVLISLAPTVQWWFAVCNLPEMLIFSQGALLCVYNYMNAEKDGRKICIAAIFTWCLGGYIFAFYPAWQLSIGYVFVGLMIYVILENKKGFAFRWKREVTVIIGSLLILAASVLYILSKSSDTVQAIMGTVYPGSRSSTGGGQLYGLFKYGASIFFPITNHGLNTNTCEASAFFDLFPMGILLSLYVIFIEKKKDRMLIPLLIAQGILICYCVFGFPGFLSKAMLLKYTPANRALIAIGFNNILLLIRSLALAERSPKMGIAAVLSLAMSVAVVLFCYNATGDYIKIFGAPLAAILFAGFFLTLVARSAGWKKLFALFCTVVVIISGGLVNPVQQGTDVIYKNELVQSIRTIAEKDHGLWIVEGSYPLANLPIMAGAPTVNSTNVYPDIERLHLLDPDGQYNNVYNRYAHIEVKLTDEETRFDLIYTDSYCLTLNYRDLRTLNIEYILSSKDYSKFNNPYVKLTLIGQAKGYYIYRVNYY